MVASRAAECEAAGAMGARQAAVLGEAATEE